MRWVAILSTDRRCHAKCKAMLFLVVDSRGFVRIEQGLISTALAKNTSRMPQIPSPIAVLALIYFSTDHLTGHATTCHFLRSKQCISSLFSIEISLVFGSTSLSLDTPVLQCTKSPPSRRGLPIHKEAPTIPRGLQSSS